MLMSSPCVWMQGNLRAYLNIMSCLCFVVWTVDMRCLCCNHVVRWWCPIRVACWCRNTTHRLITQHDCVTLCCVIWFVLSDVCNISYGLCSDVLWNSCSVIRHTAHNHSLNWECHPRTCSDVNVWCTISHIDCQRAHYVAQCVMCSVRMWFSVNLIN